MTNPLAWFMTEEGTIFPGCTDCCRIVGSPPAHEAATAAEMKQDELDDLLPVLVDTIQRWHDFGHGLPTPAVVSKRKNKAIASA